MLRMAWHGRVSSPSRRQFQGKISGFKIGHVHGGRQARLKKYLHDDPVIRMARVRRFQEETLGLHMAPRGARDCEWVENRPRWRDTRIHESL
jgi:hypothetical protein